MKSGSIPFKSLATIALVTLVTGGVWAITALRPVPAQAIPMLADRTGASCELCHTVFPGMTNFGMMVMMSNFSMTPYHAGGQTGFTSLVFEQDYVSSVDDDPAPPKFHTDNLGFLSGGYFGPHFTYYLEQHVIDGGFVGGTDQLWVSYNELFGGTGSLQFGKFHTPFPFMPAHRITMAPYATTSATQGENDFNEDDSHWGVTLSQMQGTLMFGISALGGGELIEPGAFQLAGDHSHSIDFTMMTMSDNPFNYGVGIIRGLTPVDDGFDAFSRSAVYLQYIPARDRKLQIQAVGQIGSDADSSGTGEGSRTRGGFLEAQYLLAPRNWGVLRWDTQTGDSAVAGATLEFIHQLTPNTRVTIEGRKLTTGDSFGAAFEWAGPWSRSHVLATPILGSMPGMGNMNMSGMNMGQTSALVATLQAGDATHGAALFRDHSCAQCHGAGGIGGGVAPALVGVAQSLPPESIYDFIKNPRKPMPDFHLSDKEIGDLVAFVDTLTPGHNVATDLAAEHPMGSMSGMSGMSGMSMAQAPPIYPPDQAPLDDGPHGHFPGIESGDPRNGATLFAANCASCHGAGGTGGDSPKLVGLATSATPSFIAWRIKEPVAPMPKIKLTDRQIVDLAAYLETLDATTAPQSTSGSDVVGLNVVGRAQLGKASHVVSRAQLGKASHVVGRAQLGKASHVVGRAQLGKASPTGAKR